MTEAISSVFPVEAERYTPQKELPSFSLISSLPDFDKRTGHWHGLAVLHGRQASIDVDMYGRSFPVRGEILVGEGPGNERWSFEQSADSLDYKLVNAQLPSMLMPHMATPGGGFYGVGVHLSFRRHLRNPDSPVKVDDINVNRSSVSGPVNRHVIAAVIDELLEVASAIKSTRG